MLEPPELRIPIFLNETDLTLDSPNDVKLKLIKLVAPSPLPTVPTLSGAFKRDPTNI